MSNQNKQTPADSLSKDDGPFSITKMLANEEQLPKRDQVLKLVEDHVEDKLQSLISALVEERKKVTVCEDLEIVDDWDW